MTIKGLKQILENRKAVRFLHGHMPMVYQLVHMANMNEKMTVFNLIRKNERLENASGEKLKPYKDRYRYQVDKLKDFGILIDNENDEDFKGHEKPFRFTPEGMELVTDPNFIKHIRKAMKLISSKSRRDKIAAANIASRNGKDIKNLFQRVREEIGDVEDTLSNDYHLNDEAILFRVEFFRFEQECLYDLLVENRNGFMYEFTDFLELLELYRKEIRRWIQIKRDFYQAIKDHINRSLDHYRIGFFSGGILPNTYNENILDWIWNGYEYYYVHKNKDYFSENYKDVKIGHKQLDKYIDVQVNTQTVMKIDPMNETNQVIGKFKKSIEDIIIIQRDSEYSRLFIEYYRILMNKDRIKKSIMDDLDHILTSKFE